MLNLKVIIGDCVDSSMSEKTLTPSHFSDKVMHINPTPEYFCNTLSGAYHDLRSQAKSTPRCPFHKTVMLDDRTTCGTSSIFDSIGATLSDRDRVLQQFYSQWGLV